MTGKNRYYSLFRALLFVSVIIMPQSCNLRNSQSFNTTIPIEGWSRYQITSFTPQISDTVSSYDILISIRNNHEYPYRNLFLFVSTISPEGFSLKDTIEYQLANEKGEWFGKGLGDIHNLSVPFKSNVRFPSPGEYSFKIEQGMRVDNLPGIIDVGLIIKKRDN